MFPAVCGWHSQLMTACMPLNSFCCCAKRLGLQLPGAGNDRSRGLPDSRCPFLMLMQSGSDFNGLVRAMQQAATSHCEAEAAAGRHGECTSLHGKFDKVDPLKD